MSDTMTRLPSDAFLPPGTIDHNAIYPLPTGFAGYPSSVISPLALPRGATGYFDETIPLRAHPESSYMPLPSHAADRGKTRDQVLFGKTYSPLASPPSRGLPIPQPSRFFSPRLAPTTKDLRYMQRSTSLSPTGRLPYPAWHDGGSGAPFISPPSSTQPTLTFRPPTTSSAGRKVSGAMFHGAVPALPAPSDFSSRAGSAAIDTASPAPLEHIIERLIQQNSRIREAWEAERKYMEANRERAEEVYKEERALMEEERAEWAAERDALMRQIAALQQQVVGLAGDRPRLDSRSISTSRDGRLSTQGLRGGGGSDSSPGSADSARLSQQVPSDYRFGRLTGSGDAPVRDPSLVFQSFGDAVSRAADVSAASEQPRLARFSPPRWRESSPSFHHVPNHLHQTTSSAPVEMSSSPPKREDPSPIPTIDVQEIIPTLEGIPIKATALQRSTFTDGEPPAHAFPPAGAPASPPSDQPRHGPGKRGSSEQTLQVLAAHESVRLTMHAGHTPNHSLSVLPTMTPSVITTASSGGEATPTIQRQDEVVPAGVARTGPVETASGAELHGYHEDHPEPVLEAQDDVELKGPLMVRNMPAHDEIFFKCLSDKLEEVSRASDGDTALPAVLKDSPAAERLSSQASAVDEDTVDPEQDSSRDSDGEESAIPMKLKRTQNFGAPFGMVR
ncbi:hypothetical protein VTK73DRAFT_2925 [Phialemonium thermophilum]|uniref:Uncharacterized protein n=1 Tax=Phialemonium thermophilum TaxID=223376 RepID=A0ABR3X1M1_9PEZI